MIEYNKSMRILFFLSLLIYINQVNAYRGKAGSLRSDKEFYENLDQFYDPKVDYALFPGRVSDKDATGSVIKVITENNNVKLFRAGDAVKFRVSRMEHRDPCIGYVRDVEKDYFVLFVKDFFPCWGNKENYFRRGTQLSFDSPMLSKRVKDAAIYRVLLIKRKRDYLRQLNDINHFVWSYDQERIKTAASYDKKIAKIEKKKQKALSFLALKKNDHTHLQKELAYRLDELDKDIEYYRVEKVELLKDRWNTDHDLGHPVGRRPQEMIPKNKSNAFFYKNSRAH